jgi:hypothetical protein
MIESEFSRNYRKFETQFLDTRIKSFLKHGVLFKEQNIYGQLRKPGVCYCWSAPKINTACITQEDGEKNEIENFEHCFNDLIIKNVLAEHFAVISSSTCLQQPTL